MFFPLLRAYKWRFFFNLLLIFLESGLSLLFPLFIGFAIDDALIGQSGGALLLGALGMFSLLIGAGRRFFDTRFYARMFQALANKVMTNNEERSTSLKTARLGMLNELIEFLENSLPALIASITALIGVIIVIVTLSSKVFLGCLLATLIIALIYIFTGKKTIRLNQGYNDELEKRVDVLSSNDPERIENHIKEMMRWNIKLSDLETLNFSVSWTFLMAFLVVSIVISADGNTMSYGMLFALVMYVFQFMESVIALPLFFQQWLRLVDIKTRIGEF